MKAASTRPPALRHTPSADGGGYELELGDLGGQDGERPTASLIPRQQPTSGLSPAQSRIRRRASGIDTFDTEELGRSEPSAAAANHHTKPKKVKPFVAAVAVVAALGGLVFGYDIGGSGGSFVMIGFRQHFGWPVPIPQDGEEPRYVLVQMSLINALFPLGALFGALLAGTLADSLGRCPAITGSALLFTVAAALQAGAPVMAILLVGRVVGGVAIGVLSAIVPVYISEMAPEHYRGMLSTLWQLAVTAGILLAAAMNVGLAHWDEGWRLSYGFNLVFSLGLAMLMMTIMPESPRWLCMKDRWGDAAAVLLRVRWPEDVECLVAALLRLGPRIIPQPEVDEIRMKIDDECSEGEGTWREVLSFGHQASGGRTLLGAGLQLFQQVTGINAIMFFAPELFARYFTAGGALYGALMVNALNHAATYATVFLVDRLGRVTLLVGSGSGMASCLMAAAALTRSGGSSTASNAAGYALIALSCGFVVSFAVGWGPVVWTVCAEMFPLRVRGKAISISTAVNWASATAVGLLFPLISSENALGISGTFAGFAACCLVGTVLVHLFLPETADVSLEDIDKAFERHRPNPFRKFWEKGSSLR